MVLRIPSRLASAALVGHRPAPPVWKCIACAAWCGRPLANTGDVDLVAVQTEPDRGPDAGPVELVEVCEACRGGMGR
jgi:hypothetical protein